MEELAAYHEDTISALKLYFSDKSPDYLDRFAGYSLEQISEDLEARLDESEIRSSLAVLTSLEAKFRVDFNARCQNRYRDDLSRHFREIERVRGDRSVRLDEDILEGWKRHAEIQARLISELRSAFNFRHWLAHGRYWIPKFGRRFDFDSIFIMATAVVSGFPFKD